jgi:hypothetical protein
MDDQVGACAHEETGGIRVAREGIALAEQECYARLAEVG